MLTKLDLPDYWQSMGLDFTSRGTGMLRLVRHPQNPKEKVRYLLVVFEGLPSMEFARARAIKAIREAG